MNPPGTSKDLLKPCNKMALQLLYQSGKRVMISIVRTNEDGKFEIEFPEVPSWRISSTSDHTITDVDVVPQSDGSKQFTVIVRPAH